jgi:hypothetical protein
MHKDSRQELVMVWSKVARDLNGSFIEPFDSLSLKIGIKFKTAHGLVSVNGIDQWGMGRYDRSIIQTQFEVLFDSSPTFNLTIEAKSILNVFQRGILRRGYNMPESVSTSTSYWVDTDNKVILMDLASAPARALFKGFEDLYIGMNKDKKTMLITYSELITDTKKLKRFIRYSANFTEMIVKSSLQLANSIN